jgi:enoyl-CoA hydratase
VLITVEVDRSIATATMNRPPVNAINDDWLTAFHQVLDELDSRDDWTLLHIRSGLKVFSAGADLTHLRANFAERPNKQAEFGRRLQWLLSRIESLPGITLADMAGGAFGGGLELGLACDLRVTATSAALGLPEVALGLIPGGGGTQRLTRLCGRGTALRMILGGERISGTEALRIGLVQWCFSPVEYSGEVDALTRRLSQMPRHAAQAAKACIAAAESASQQGYEFEIDAVRRLLGDDRTRTLVQVFLDGRKG